MLLLGVIMGGGVCIQKHAQGVAALRQHVRLLFCVVWVGCMTNLGFMTRGVACICACVRAQGQDILCTSCAPCEFIFVKSLSINIGYRACAKAVVR